MKKRILSMIFAAFTVLNLCSCSNTTTQDNTQKSSQNETQQENNQSSQSIEDSATSSSDGWQAEEGTSDRVNEIIFKGRDDAETATDETIKAAVQWFKDNEANIFEGSENMEQAMYYGSLLETKYKDTGNNYENLGWQAIKSVKYVYRGAETIADAHDNIVELKELINSVE